MDTRPLVAFLTLFVFAAGARAAEDEGRKVAKDEPRLESKCGKEQTKELRDADRGRRHPAPDNKWDDLCAPPPPPPPVIPPPVVPPPPDGSVTGPVLPPPPIMPPPAAP